ncbi:MAG: hypothetical protein A3I66_10060 [Burkholderiales bacterium RIFCSPLOWO2_02_FULL_57_36]|nr:MAG: hypothetical protein A3I66_10060 [Burkholderiales bacterium RIFCSPLOWO2_02_FULL_57_36]
MIYVASLLNNVRGCAFTRRICRISLIICIFIFISAPSGNAIAEPILDYRETLLELDKSSSLVLPQSVFHAWEIADAEAGKIVKAWQTEQTTVPWTRVQLERHMKHKIMPTRGARGLALMHVAMHDAYDIAAARKMNAKLVVSMAAAQVLGYLFTAEEKAFDRIAFAVAAQLSRTGREMLPADARRAIELGYAIGRHVVRHGETDGAQKGWNGIRLQWYGEGRYYGPGTWEPTPPYFYYPPDEPFAPTWRTWALDRADEFRPIPPAYGSPKYIQDLQEVVRINQNLRPEQLKIAKFWVDGSGSVTPPGHWNAIAIDEIVKSKLDDVTTARLFAHLNMAQADAFIAVWDTKYHYWSARPITVAKSLLGVGLVPAILTPPFPSYVSGHAAFSGAAARIIGAYLPKHAKRLDTMAAEAAESRLLGGIHFRHDNEDGLQLGRKVAEKVLTRFAVAH